MKKRITIINDDIDFIDAIQMLLQEIGSYETSVIHEGEKAYQLVKKEPPDLIILDIRMDSPHRGWSILDLLKLDPQVSNIPVIVATASTLDEEKTNWLKNHNIDWLLKPFDIDDLTSLIEVNLLPPQKPSLRNDTK